MNSTLAGIEVIYEDEQLIAINKPHGLLVHRTRMANDATEFALQKVRKYLGKRVYPVHRLDRKTAGALLFAKEPQTNVFMQKKFAAGEVKKYYLAIVRGYTEEKGLIDYDLRHNGKVKSAVTAFSLLEQYELPIPSGKFKTSRYSLVGLTPRTGRFHQIRKHMAHIMHPILGDRPHGCNKQNRTWKERYAMTTMLLHAHSLEFTGPGGQQIAITAEVSSEFERVLNILREGKADRIRQT